MLVWMNLPHHHPPLFYCKKQKEDRMEVSLAIREGCLVDAIERRKERKKTDVLLSLLTYLLESFLVSFLFHSFHASLLKPSELLSPSRVYIQPTERHQEIHRPT